MTDSNSSTDKVGQDQIKPSLSKDRSLSRKKRRLSKLKRSILKRVWLVRFVILIFLFGSLCLLAILARTIISRTSLGYYLTLTLDFLFTPKEKILSIGGRTNILILGKGGNGHDAPDLTDTIIFASINHKQQSIALISLPRDIWIPELRAKLNSTYYWGNQKQDGGGLILAKSGVEKIIGQPISYGVVIDFSGFREMVDVLGGIEVEVETGFVDEKYPIEGRENDNCGGDPEYRCRYETLRFTQGEQLMDGETALKFVRSRNAEGDEGTDFARQARQQKVVMAIKNKILSKEVLLSYKKLVQLKEVIFKYTETDINDEAVAILARRFLQSKDSVHSSVLPEDLLVNPPKSPKYDNLYVFIPKDNSWDKVHEWVECVLENGKCN